MIVAAACSACGKTHVRNDDRVLVQDCILSGAEAPDAEAGLTLAADEPPFSACVFDGVGGSVRGDKAAATAARSLMENASVPLEERLVLCAQDVVSGQEGLSHRERAFTVGAGVSIERLDAHGLAARIFHMGDCRVYRVRGQELVLLTKDHSLAQRFKDELGMDTDVPNNIAHVVTAYAGGEIANPFETSHPIHFQPGDIFLMCSDGFWEHAGMDQTIEAFERTQGLLADPSAGLTSDQLQETLLWAARHLVHTAQRNGSSDDVSVALVWNCPVMHSA